MELLKSRLEKDFEAFVKGIANLDGPSFYGLCKILCVEVYENEKELKQQACLHFGKEEKELTKEESAAMQEKIKEWAERLSKEFPQRKMEDMMNDLMDKFLSIGKKQRRDILTILKDYKRGS